MDIFQEMARKIAGDSAIEEQALPTSSGLLGKLWKRSAKAGK